MKYKAIRSAAHNFGASFASGLNWAGGDQTMSHLVRAAVSSGVNEMSVDLLSGQAGPPPLVTPAIAEAVGAYARKFPQFLARQQVDVGCLSAAAMIVRFDLEKAVGGKWGLSLPRVPFECIVTVVDDRGKEHVGRVQDIWPCTPNGPSST